MTECTERGVFMGYIKGIFERATIQGISDYLLFGSGPERDERMNHIDGLQSMIKILLPSYLTCRMK